jgi:hypothetical protein
MPPFAAREKTSSLGLGAEFKACELWGGIGERNISRDGGIGDDDVK